MVTPLLKKIKIYIDSSWDQLFLLHHIESLKQQDVLVAAKASVATFLLQVMSVYACKSQEITAKQL